MKRLTVGDLMALGLGQLKIAPEVFWRMTLPELKAAAAGGLMQVKAAIGRAELEALIRQYPDDDDGGGR
jgi:uncharacterized phage protein (TIGR02216 family)